MASESNSIFTHLILNTQQLRDFLPPNPRQLEDIAVHFELLLLALDSLIEIKPRTLQQKAVELNIPSAIAEKIESFPQERQASSPNPLELDVARSLVVVISQLAQENRELLRRAVTLLEQTHLQPSAIQRTLLLKTYLQRFEQRLSQSGQKSLISQADSHLALKLLVDLLFYSDVSGSRRLWHNLIGI